MIDKIYAVNLNGNGVVEEYKVTYETPKTYRIDRHIGNCVRKATMCDRWQMYFTDIVQAREFYHQNKNRIEKACKTLDVNYVYKMLKTIQAEEFITDKLELLIDYIEEYL
jgi:hypothetical protein